MKMPGKMLPKILGYIFKKPITTLYPKERLVPPDTLRGKMKFHLDRCISCGLCARDCPSGACTMHDIHEIDDTNTPVFDQDSSVVWIESKKRPMFDLDFCTFCAQCAESCPKDAIEMTSEFELAHYKKGEAIVK